MKILYQDPHFEKMQASYLEDSRLKLQRVLNEWSKLDLMTAETGTLLYDLVWHPQETFQDAINQRKRSADKLPKDQKERFLQRFQPPDPSGFFAAVQDAQNDAFTERAQMLFDIQGKDVILNEEEANKIIKAETIEAETKDQEEFYKNLETAIKALNKCEEISGGRFLGEDWYSKNALWSTPFATPMRPGGSYRLDVRPENLRKLFRYF